MVGLCVLSLAIQGCASLPLSGKNGENLDNRHVVYAVKPGDSLSDISEKLTGDVNNWQTIAEYNEITDPRKLAAGDSINIPQHLLENTYEISSRSTAQSVQQTDSVAAATAQSRPVPPTVGTTTMAVQRALDTPAPDFGDVIVHAVSVNRSFDLIPFEQTSLASNRSVRFASSAPSVRVIGTYFPKGIYEGPANYSRLIMRVSPGTIFEFDSEVNGWYKVVTDRGIGYVRSGDAVLVDESPF